MNDVVDCAPWATTACESRHVLIVYQARWIACVIDAKPACRATLQRGNGDETTGLLCEAPVVESLDVLVVRGRAVREGSVPCLLSDATKWDVLPGISSGSWAFWRVCESL